MASHTESGITGSVVSIDDQAVYTAVSVSPANPDKELLRQFHELCVETFGADDVEDLDIWEGILDRGAATYYTQAFHLVLRRSLQAPHDTKIVGGCSEELYKGSQCGMMTYICVSPTMRGKGLAGHLLERCKAAQNARSISGDVPLLIEVEQVNQEKATRHTNTPDTMDAGKRQIVWKKLGFLPMPFGVEQPGKRGGHFYQFCLYSPSNTVSATVERDTVSKFVSEYHQGVMEDEGITTCAATGPVLDWLEKQPHEITFTSEGWN